MSLRDKQLKKLKSERTLVDIYTDAYKESDYAFIADFNDDFLLAEVFDSDSRSEGISIFRNRNVSRIRWGGNDLESTYMLMDNQLKKRKDFVIDLSSVESILKDVNSLFGYITVHIQNIDDSICFIGQIHEMDEEYVVIHEFGTKLSLDRKFIMIGLDDITKIDAGGEYENNLKKLFSEPQRPV